MRLLNRINEVRLLNRINEVRLLNRINKNKVKVSYSNQRKNLWKKIASNQRNA